MEFIKKINFVINHLDTYDDFCKIPTTHKIHEKTILTAKKMLYNNSKVHSFINIHACLGLITMILDFPTSLNRHEKYINDFMCYDVMCVSWNTYFYSVIKLLNVHSI